MPDDDPEEAPGTQTDPRVGCRIGEPYRSRGIAGVPEHAVEGLDPDQLDVRGARGAEDERGIEVPEEHRQDPGATRTGSGSSYRLAT
jgi:hypothetical protein